MMHSNICKLTIVCLSVFLLIQSTVLAQAAKKLEIPSNLPAELKQQAAPLVNKLAGMANQAMAAALKTELESFFKTVSPALATADPKVQGIAKQFASMVLQAVDMLAGNPKNISLSEILQKLGQKFQKDFVVELNKNSTGAVIGQMFQNITILDPSFSVRIKLDGNELANFALAGKILVGGKEVKTSFTFLLFKPESGVNFFGLPVPIGLSFTYELENGPSLADAIGKICLNQNIAKNLAKADLIQCTNLCVCITSYPFADSKQHSMKPGVNIFAAGLPSGYLEDARQKHIQILSKLTKDPYKFYPATNVDMTMRLTAWISIDLKGQSASLGCTGYIPVHAGVKAWENQKKEFGFTMESKNFDVNVRISGAQPIITANWKDIFKVKIPHNSSILTFTRTCQLDVADMELNFALTMQGAWQNAFGISGLVLGSDNPGETKKGLALKMSLTPNSPYLTEVGFAGGGSFALGNRACDIFVARNVNILDPLKSGLYLKLEETRSITDILASVNKLAEQARPILAESNIKIFDGTINITPFQNILKPFSNITELPEIQVNEAVFAIALGDWQVGELSYTKGFTFGGTWQLMSPSLFDKPATISQSLNEQNKDAIIDMFKANKHLLSHNMSITEVRKDQEWRIVDSTLKQEYAVLKDASTAKLLFRRQKRVTLSVAIEPNGFNVKHSVIHD